MGKKRILWYQPYVLSDLALSGVMTICSNAPLDIQSVGKKKLIKELLSQLDKHNQKNNVAARELLLLSQKVKQGDLLIIPLNDKGLNFRIALINGDYQFDKVNINYLHSRSLSLFNGTWSKDDLPIKFYRELSLCLRTPILQRVNLNILEFCKTLDVVIN